MALDPQHTGRPDNRTGRSDLGDTEDMLRRLLNLEGLVPMDWGGIISPVAMVGDCTLPGYGRQRLRRWQQPNILSFAAGGDQCIKVTGDVIIDRVHCFLVAASSVVVAFMGSDEADPGVVNLRTAPFLDRASSGAERAPILNANVAGGYGNTIYTTGATALPAGVFEIIKQPFFMATGSKLRLTSGANVMWTIEGRTF